VKLELRGLAASHPAARVGALALQALNLQVAAGEQLAVIGPSGAGKTTLLQVMACALPPRAGTLQLDGQDPWALPRRALQRLRGRLFLAPQVPPLPPRQRVVTSVLAGRLPSMGLLARLIAGSRPASTEVTTRWRGGSGGTCGARNKRPRSRRRSLAPMRQGSVPPSCTRPPCGGSAAAATCSRVVLPAPEGPITATCSPAATRNDRPRRAAADSVRAAGCRASTPSKLSSTAPCRARIRAAPR